MADHFEQPRHSAGPGHHIADGRNVILGNQGSRGSDVFFAAVQMTRMPMCLSDPHAPDNPLVFVNAAFCELTGYSEKEIIGRNCRFLQGERTGQEAVAAIGAAIRERRDISVELYNYRKNGTGFWNALFLSPVFDAHGSLLYFFGSQIDITKRREAEAMLERSQRMEALGSLAAGVAHEFNNLMTIVAGSLEQAASQPSSQRQTTQLQRAAWAADRAGRLTQQMLSFSRRQFHDPRDAELSELVRGMDSLITQSATPGTQVDIALDGNLLPIRIDSGQFELAILNLVRNAVDAMPAGGTLRVCTRRAGDGLAALEVEDSGEGMPPEILRRATEPFFTTKPPGSGTGLGLSMVHGFAEQSGGRLEIESVPGKGTKVRLLLPIASP